MKKIKNWIIHKLGGYTADQYCDLRAENEAKEQYLRTYIPTTVISRNVVPIRATRIIPCVDGDWEYYLRQKVADLLSDCIYNNDLIDWELTDTPEGTKLIGTIYVAERANEIH